MASEISSFTVNSTVKVLSSFLMTDVIARSAASCAIPLDMSSSSTPITWRIASPAVRSAKVSPVCARLTLSSFAVLLGHCHGLVLVSKEIAATTDHEWRGSCLKTSRTVVITSDLSRSTRKVSSEHLWKTPCVPVTPSPSTISRVSRKGTFSGTGSSFPYG